MRKITIRNENLSTNKICINSKHRWCRPSQWGGNYETQVTLTEEEIYENAARAVREVEQAEEGLRLAQLRAESLRLFVGELIKSEQLSVVNG